jgi:hypothetical protein
MTSHDESGSDSAGQETAEAKARREREDLEEQTRAGAPDGSLKDLMVKNAWDFRVI